MHDSARPRRPELPPLPEALLKQYSELNGLLIIDKPVGLTSHDVVHRVRKRSRIARVGHTGTLDPFATGVLPLCLGRATRLAGLLTLEDKVYEATLKLGVTTSTLDLEGEVLEEKPVPEGLTVAEVERVFAPLRGEIQQRPPMYSAVKVGGKRLYEYARAGEEIERAARTVQILALELLSLDAPFLRFRVHCSKGTYVRVLAADIGEALGCGGHLTALRRTATGPFDLARAVTLEDFEAHCMAGTLPEVILPMRMMVPEVPQLELNPVQAGRVRHGNPILHKNLGGLAQKLPAPGLVLLVFEGEVLALADVLASSGAPDSPAIQPRAVMVEA